MGSNRHRAWKLAIATAAILGTIIIVPSAIASGPKEATTTATASVDGGTTANIDIAIKNTSTSGNITGQAFRIYIPSTSNLAVSQIVDVQKNPTTLAGTITAWQLPSGTLSKSTPYIEVLNANITKGSTYTIRLQTKIACSDKGDVYPWQIDVRQSNDFNGTNNQIPNAVGNNPSTSVTTGCALVFTAQPHNAVPGATITDTNFNQPAGGPVKVAVKAADGAGATVTDFSGSASLVTNPSTTLAGTTSQNFVSGVASFGDLSIAAANTYTLTASTTGASDGTSSSFTVDYGVTTSCTAGDKQACSTGTIPGPEAGTTGSITVNDSDGLTADLTAKFYSGSIDCSSVGYVEFGDNLFFDVTNVLEGDTAGLTKTVTLTKQIPADRPSTTGVDEWRYQLCFQSRDQFEAVPTYSSDPTENYNQLLQALSNGDYTDPAELVPTSPVNERVLGDKSQPEYRGLLPKCSLVPNTVPCLSSVTFNGNGTVTFVATVPIGDPMGR